MTCRFTFIAYHEDMLLFCLLSAKITLSFLWVFISAFFTIPVFVGVFYVKRVIKYLMTFCHFTVKANIVLFFWVITLIAILGLLLFKIIRIILLILIFALVLIFKFFNLILILFFIIIIVIVIILIVVFIFIFVLIHKLFLLNLIKVSIMLISLNIGPAVWTITRIFKPLLHTA